MNAVVDAAVAAIRRMEASPASLASLTMRGWMESALPSLEY